jgi:hypothetical protein
MNWKQILVTVVIVMLGIWVFKWVNSQYQIPIFGKIVEEV